MAGLDVVRPIVPRLREEDIEVVWSGTSYRQERRNPDGTNDMNPSWRRVVDGIDELPARARPGL